MSRIVIVPILSVSNKYVCEMFRQYFKYDSTAKEYLLHEAGIDYRTSLLLMLKFGSLLEKKALNSVQALEIWVSGLTEEDAKSLVIGQREQIKLLNYNLKTGRFIHIPVFQLIKKKIITPESRDFQGYTAFFKKIYLINDEIKILLS